MSKYSPLHQYHQGAGAKLADFGGWEMPIEYPATNGGGVLNEHRAVRETVGLFDVSHLGKVSVTGPGALDYLNSIFTNDLNRISDGQAQYTLICDDSSGGVIDDLIAYRYSEEEIFLIPNAANTSEVVRRLSESAPAGIVITNLHEHHAVMALQGPQSRAVLSALGVNSNLDYMSFEESKISGVKVILCRTGYTGELGYEILAKWGDAPMVWDALLDAVERLGGRAAGLGARDTLRTEMGYPLHGHELSLEITPVQAGSTWAVGWKKETFRGSEALRAEKEAGPRRILRGLQSTDRGIPRAGMDVKNSDGKVIGVITSGTFSPSLKKGIALALVEPVYVVGDSVVVDVRGRESIAQVVALPMVESHVR